MSKTIYQIRLFGTIPWNPSIIYNVEDIDVFLEFKVFNSENSQRFSSRKNAQVIFVENPQLKT